MFAKHCLFQTTREIDFAKYKRIDYYVGETRSVDSTRLLPRQHVSQPP